MASRIYLVEDHAIVRDGLRAMLESGGHAVVGQAGDVAAALAEIRHLQPDVVLLDLHLEGGSGHELLDAMRQRGLRARVIVLTMSEQPRDVAEAVRAGAAGYVLKTAARADLLAAVQAVGQGRHHLGPAVAELALRALDEVTDADLLARLSPRERQIVTMVVQGESSSVIAARLNLSSKTIDTYRSRLMAKLGVADVTALVRFAIRAGLIDQ